MVNSRLTSKRTCEEAVSVVPVKDKNARWNSMAGGEWVS